jgi:biotin-dependent carboxylase-like uncharacterized protein
MIVILDPGALTTVQDRGRYGQLRFGIPPSGPMDDHACVIANRLVGNTDAAAALECTLSGPRFKAEIPCAMAVTGAEMPVKINGTPAPTWTTLRLAPGDEVRIAMARSGLRGYVAFGGGIALPGVMGSQSTYLRGRMGGLKGRMLKAGDRLALNAADMPAAMRMPAFLLPHYESEIEAHVVLGPQSDRFTDRGIAAFLASTYAMLPQSDRMGARLKGERIEHAAGHDIVSDGTALGSIQVPGDGQPIVLLVDRQSTGGYTKIATVCSFDIRRIAQLRPGQSVRFKSVTVEQAHVLLATERAALAALTLEKIS